MGVERRGISIPPEMYQRLAAEAERERRSVSAHIVYLCERGMDQGRRVEVGDVEVLMRAVGVDDAKIAALVAALKHGARP
jgi:predicted CopG family antitoxin